MRRWISEGLVDYVVPQVYSGGGMVLDPNQPIGWALEAAAATGGEVTFTHPCLFHWWFSIQNKQGGMKMTLPPVGRG